MYISTTKEQETLSFVAKCTEMNHVLSIIIRTLSDKYCIFLSYGSQFMYVDYCRNDY